MTKIHTWSMMTYLSLEAQFMETKQNGHIQRYGTPIFGNTIVYVFKQ